MQGRDVHNPRVERSVNGTSMKFAAFYILYAYFKYIVSNEFCQEYRAGLLHTGEGFLPTF